MTFSGALLKPLHRLKRACCCIPATGLLHACKPCLAWCTTYACCCTLSVITAAAQPSCSSHQTPAGALLDAIAGCTLLNGTPCSGDPGDAALAEEAVQCRLMLDSSLAHLGEGGSSLASGFMESMLVPGSQVRPCGLGT